MSKSFDLHLIPYDAREETEILTGFPTVAAVADYIGDNIQGTDREDTNRIMVFQSDLPPTRDTGEKR